MSQNKEQEVKEKPAAADRDKDLPKSVMQDRIIRARREWEATVDSLEQIVLMLDAWGIIMRGNRAVEHWNLAKIKEINGRHFHDLFHPNCIDPGCYMKTTWPLALKKLIQNQAYSLEQKDPVLNRYLSIQFRPLVIDKTMRTEETSIMAVVVIQDITQSKLVLERISQAASEMKSVFDAIPDSYIRLDAQGVIRAFKSGTSMENFFISQDSIGKNILEVVPLTLKNQYCETLKKVKKNQAMAVIETNLATPKGDQIYEARFLPLFDNQVDIINRNITEQKRLLAIAENMNLMENLGYIFSGIRHEIGNPINAIKMTASVLKNNIEHFPRERVLEYIGRILTEVNRLEYLLKNLKNFNMFEEMNIIDIQLSDYLGKIIALVETDLNQKGIRLTCTIPEEVGQVAADPRALHQALLNLLGNSAEALGGVQDPTISITAQKLPDNIRLNITDNGHGISEANKENIFKPFFTTKPEGTGLGLNIVQKIISRIGGTIRIESQEGKGTSVILHIPAGKGSKT